MFAAPWHLDLLLHLGWTFPPLPSDKCATFCLLVRPFVFFPHGRNGNANRTSNSTAGVERVRRGGGTPAQALAPRAQAILLCAERYSNTVVAEVRDIVGRMNPPERPMVLSADEKSPIQGLARTQPLLLLQRDQLIDDYI